MMASVPLASRSETTTDKLWENFSGSIRARCTHPFSRIPSTNAASTGPTMFLDTLAAEKLMRYFHRKNRMPYDEADGPRRAEPVSHLDKVLTIKIIRYDVKLLVRETLERLQCFETVRNLPTPQCVELFLV